MTFTAFKGVSKCYFVRVKLVRHLNSVVGFCILILCLGFCYLMFTDFFGSIEKGGFMWMEALRRFSGKIFDHAVVHRLTGYYGVIKGNGG